MVCYYLHCQRGVVRPGHDRRHNWCLPLHSSGAGELLEKAIGSLWLQSGNHLGWVERYWLASIEHCSHDVFQICNLGVLVHGFGVEGGIQQVLGKPSGGLYL